MNAVVFNFVGDDYDCDCDCDDDAVVTAVDQH